MSSFVQRFNDGSIWGCLDDFFGHHEYGYIKLENIEEWYKVNEDPNWKSRVINEAKFTKLTKGLERVHEPTEKEHVEEEKAHPTDTDVAPTQEEIPPPMLGAIRVDYLLHYIGVNKQSIETHCTHVGWTPEAKARLVAFEEMENFILGQSKDMLGIYMQKRSEEQIPEFDYESIANGALLKEGSIQAAHAYITEQIGKQLETITNALRAQSK